MRPFRLHAPFLPAGDQPQAIDELVAGVERGDKHQVLLGVTGSGKTFTIAQVVERTQRPTLVMAHNKTLAAQLYQEFKELFPDNAVEYFVSYYDYYQPEAYVPSTDTFIEKDAQINDAIDRMRLSATRSLLERRDVLIVASVSCIYGLGSAEAFYGMLVHVEVGQRMDRDGLLRKLVGIQYERRDHDFHRGTFRVRGDSVDIFPAYEEQTALRLSFFGDELEAIETIDPLRGQRIASLDRAAIYPATHYVVTPELKQRAITSIREELALRLEALKAEGLALEARRLEDRTTFDLEMLTTVGFCHGIENYSRHLTGRAVGEAPPCLLDYFPKPWLLVVDESHATLPQVGSMYRGDQSRKKTLVDHGFRLPSALDNRPLRFDEFEALVQQAIYVSATPGDHELGKAGGVVVEQLLRPTGLLDPIIEVRPARMQVDDLVGEIRKHTRDMGDRVLVTTLTKRMAEDLAEFLREQGFRVAYLHSDLDTLERVDVLRDLREGSVEVVVGINLLREGLDLPEVSLVAILDADKAGFLRAHRSLIQTAGRAARNARGRVLMYADEITEAMQTCIDETLRRRQVQHAYNIAHGIEPQTVSRGIRRMGHEVSRSEDAAEAGALQEFPDDEAALDAAIAAEREAMLVAAKALRFEDAARHRDRLRLLEARRLGFGAPA